MKVTTLTIFLFIASGHSQDSDKVEDDVVFLSVIQVEGLRTPRHSFHHTPGIQESWIDGWSQLTNEGKRAQYEVGQWLKTRYNKLIGQFSLPDVHFLSGDEDSLIMSAQTLAAGMYPAKENNLAWSPLAWQPVPVHTLPPSQDNIISMTQSCCKYRTELHSKEYTRAVQDADESFSYLYNYLSEQTKRRVSTVEEANLLYEALLIQESLNMSLPEWSKIVYSGLLKKTDLVALTLPTQTETMKLLRTGPLLSKLSYEMTAKYLETKLDSKESQGSRAVLVFSVPVQSLVSILDSLNLFNDVRPPFSSSLLVQLSRDKEDKYFVKMLYRNSSSDEPHVLTLPGCGEACQINEWLSLMAPHISGDWDLDCGNVRPTLQDNNYLLAEIGLITWVMLGVFLIFLIILYCIREPPHVYRKLKSTLIS